MLLRSLYRVVSWPSEAMILDWDVAEGEVDCNAVQIEPRRVRQRREYSLTPHVSSAGKALDRKEVIDMKFCRVFVEFMLDRRCHCAISVQIP